MICLVGDILTDVTLRTDSSQTKMRLGGIVHAARALWAMGVDYAVAYFAPSYMDENIEFFLKEHSCKKVIKLGNVRHCPYTMLIGEAKEIGDQAYEFLYHEDVVIDYDKTALTNLARYEKVMIISGNYDTRTVIPYIREDARMYADVANNIKTVEDLKIGRKAEILFVSTSSDIFKPYSKKPTDIFQILADFSYNIVLKENRGGSRCYCCETGEIFQIGSQTSPIQHSVGVGDVYDAVTITAPFEDLKNRLVFASWVAMEYGKTTFPDDFATAVSRLLNSSFEKLSQIPGCILPWEERRKCNIYIAAPDFDFVDTSQIEVLNSSLLYHNFIPRRPVKENGQMPAGASKEVRMQLFGSDMRTFCECNMLIAVILYDDPGTYIEIGMAAQRGIPTIVYDPYHRADNCMLTELPILVSSDMDEIISTVFIEYSKMLSHGTL